ncbi:hypothetical protein NKH10_23980 [Mesorhizobium sp. M1340]|uniref:hypothetical protein n=1 Tax=unclassified Mesorhizobium TaxID=325217 RepID=UPI00333E02D3
MNKDDEVVQKGLRYAGAKTPRQAAEYVQRRPLNEDEWNAYGPIWERNWQFVRGPGQLATGGDTYADVWRDALARLFIGTPGQVWFMQAMLSSRPILKLSRPLS